MRFRASGVLLGLGMLVSACGGAAPEPAATAPADITPINELRSRYVAAYNAGDAAAVAEFFTDDAISLPDHHTAVEGKAAIQQFLQEQFAQVTVVLTITPGDTEITGDIGHEHGTFSVTATPKAGGPTMSDTGKYLVIFKRQADGVWKIHHDIDNTNQPPEPPLPALAEGPRP